MRRISGLALLVLLTPLAFGQDMVAVDWNGGLYALDSYQAVLTPIGTGLMGQNGTAVDEVGTFWSSHVAGSGAQSTFHLTNVDPNTGTATIVFSDVREVRALAAGEPGHLFAIVNGNPDVLYDVDTTTGTFTRIGSTGLDTFQGLATMGGTLYAWNIAAGLMVMDPTTGRATDVNPAISTPPGNAIQFLGARADGKLIGGKQDLYEIDPQTGAFTLLGSFGPGVDLRGADEWYGNAQTFGVGCGTPFGTSTLVVSGTLLPGSIAITRSMWHESNAPGALLLGLSRTGWAGLTLPLDLDPLFGTQGCSMWVAMDVVLPGSTNATSPAELAFQFLLPPEVGGAVVHLQHVVLESVPGGLSTSNGVTVHFGW